MLDGLWPDEDVEQEDVLFHRGVLHSLPEDFMMGKGWAKWCLVASVSSNAVMRLFMLACVMAVGSI